LSTLKFRNLIRSSQVTVRKCVYFTTKLRQDITLTTKAVCKLRFTLMSCDKTYCIMEKINMAYPCDVILYVTVVYLENSAIWS